MDKKMPNDTLRFRMSYELLKDGT